MNKNDEGKNVSRYNEMSLIHRVFDQADGTFVTVHTALQVYLNWVIER